MRTALLPLGSVQRLEESKATRAAAERCAATAEDEALKERKRRVREESDSDDDEELART